MEDEKQTNLDGAAPTEDRIENLDQDQIESVDLEQISGGPAPPPGWGFK
jgi:hypothetical protein